MTIPAVCIGDTVPPQFRGRVYAVQERACYVRTEQADQLVLLAEDLPAAPHGITLKLGAGDFRDVIPRDAALVMRDGVLKLQKPSTAKRSWRLDAAELYHSRMDVVKRAPKGKIAAALKAVNHELEAREREHPPLDRRGQAARRRVRAAAERLAAAVAAGDEARIVTLVTGLVGFGSPPTPCGDNALIGFMAARRALGCDDEAIRRTVLESIGHTCDSSWGYLAAAADGRFVRPVARLASAVASGDDEAASRACRECLALGAAFGADGVIGLVGGFEAELSAAPRQLTAV